MQVLGPFAAFHAGSFASGLHFHVFSPPDFDTVVQIHFGGLSVAAGPGLISGANLSSFYLSLEALPVAALIVIAAMWTGVSWWMTN